MYIGQGLVTGNAVHVESSIKICVGETGKKYNVNTADHCIFCLRKISANQETTTYNISARDEQFEEVPCAPPECLTSATAPLLFALNNSWNHLQKGGYWDWDDDQAKPEQRSTQFKCFPKICYYCAAEFSSIYDLMCQLKAEINKLGVIIRESKRGGLYSWRAESFKRRLKESAVERQCISDTLEFLGIPRRNQSSSSEPTSYDTRTFGDTIDTEMPSVVAETLISDQPKEVDTSRSRFDFHDEGSEDDASIEYGDTNNDRNYVKEAEDAFSVSENSESGTEGFEDDPLDVSKSELDGSLTICPNLVEMSSAESIIMLPTSTSRVKTPIQNVISSAKEPPPKKNKFACAINGCGKTWNCLQEMKLHQQKDHSSTEQELLGQQLTNKIVCSICTEKFPTPRKLGQHIRMVHDNNTQEETNKIVCSICGKTFKAQQYLSAHIKSLHSSVHVAKITCDLCKIHVPCQELYEHVRAHVGEEYLIRCPNPNTGQCSFVCCSHRGLQIHLRGNIICRTATPDVMEKYLKPPDAVICNVCGQGLRNQLSLRVHLNDWHEKEGPKKFPCPIQGCQQRFSWRQSVVLHIPLHINKLKSCDSQPCDMCKENIMCEEMEKHLKETHHLAQETIIKCFQCPFLFSDRKSLVDHLYEHRHIALFCDICGNPDTTFYRHNDLRRHYFEVHQIGSKFLCGHCQSEFFSALRLERHLSERHPVAAEHKLQKRKPPGCLDTIAEKNFKCDECDAVYKTYNDLTAHKIATHQGKPFPCKFCDQTFTSSARKYNHEKIHRRGPVDHKEMFPCQVAGCGKQLTSKKALKSHVSWVHKGQKSHVCDQCGKAYTNNAGLKIHIQTVHMGVRNHVCDVCKESFSHGTVLKRHKLIHTGDRPFVCQLCGQKFRHKEVLKRHVEGHERKGEDFKPNGPMKQLRKRVDLQSKRKTVE